MSSKDIYIRLALLYHDLGKPQCFSIDDHNIGHFYNHAKISAEIAESSMRKLRFDNNTIEIVTQLVENHDREIQPTKTSVLRCLNKLGKDQFERLLYLKHADYLGQLLDPERDKQYNQIWEVYNQILSEESCFSLKDLEINGNDLISIGYTPGKKLGETLNHLLNLVIENNIPNRKQALLDKAYVLLEPSETCEFCKKFDFGSVRCDIGSFIPSIRFSGGSSRFPADKRFNYCPNCGRKLNHKTNQERDI
jgi:tRNA nucleotidyltransferase (CCA-adding enzyme)